MPELHSLNEMNENDNGFHTEWAIPKWIWNSRFHIKTTDSCSMIWRGLVGQMDFLQCYQLSKKFIIKIIRFQLAPLNGDNNPINIDFLFLWQGLEICGFDTV